MKRSFKERIIFLDIAKALGIIMVVLGHFETSSFLHDWIYSFHMPLFFIISGYFYKERSVNEVVWNGFIRILFPLFLVTLVVEAGLICLYFRDLSWQGPPIIGWLKDLLFARGDGYIHGTWFFYALYFAQVLFSVLLNHIKKNVLIIILLFFFTGWFLNRYFMNSIPWCLDRGLGALLYVYVGYIIHKQEYLNCKFCFVIYVVAVVLLCTASFFSIDVSLYDYPYSFISIVCSILIAFSFLLVVKWLCDKISGLNTCHRLIFLGQHSLLFFSIHCIFHNWQLHVILLNYVPIFYAIAIEMCILYLGTYYLSETSIAKYFFK